MQTPVSFYQNILSNDTAFEIILGSFKRNLLKNLPKHIIVNDLDLIVHES